jgi:hypothetical protein
VATVPVSVLGALFASVVMGRCKRLRRSERIADVAGNGTPAAVIAALLVTPGSKVTVAV